MSGRSFSSSIGRSLGIPARILRVNGQVHRRGSAWKSQLAGLCSIWMLASPSLCEAAVVPAASPSRADVGTAYDACANGDTLSIPAGSATWTTGLTIAKNIRVQGQGSGRVIARSTDTVTVGTGTKTFVLLPVPASSTPAIANGQTLRIERTGGQGGGYLSSTRAWMQGTVTSYSGGTLVMNITSTSGSGSQKLWFISTMAVTTITHAASGDLISITDNTSGHVEVGGIRFLSGSASAPIIGLYHASSGLASKIHDCYFEITSDAEAIYATTNRGLVWNCSFPAIPYTNHRLALHRTCNGLQSSWETAPTMGTQDTTGESNFYVEDCDFHAYGVATDFDSNSRQVMRHCTFNNAGLGSHGADSSPWGMRHTEIYDSEFIYNGYGDGQTFPMNWWFYLRGGCLIMTDNVMPEMDSQDYGNKAEINMTIQNLQRSAGPNPCWGAGIAGVQYPCPRQVGRGYIDGTAGFDSITFVGELEPCYFWNNTGGYSIGISDYGGAECSSPDSGAGYILAGRDYYNDGTAKPGYAKYTYPHPLRTGSSATPPAQTKNLRVRPTDSNP